MIDLVEQLISRYRHKGILVDTNILLLYFVGLFDPSQISNFKRTTQFTYDDDELLRLLLEPFERIVTTPNILTEVNSFSGQFAENIKKKTIKEPLKKEFFRKLAERLLVLEEFYIHSHESATKEEFTELGLTDVSIMILSKGNYLVLTDDFRLSQYLKTADMDVINFNHIRPAGWS